MKFITIARTLHRYWRMASDPRTPNAVRYLIIGGIAFTLIPDEWLPDWVPGLGLLDEAAVLPSVVALSMLMIPKEVKESHDAHAERSLEQKQTEGVQARAIDVTTPPNPSPAA
jgi:uncharacterized membrane protein YkvA (DUF1232 family)